MNFKTFLVENTLDSISIVDGIPTNTDHPEAMFRRINGKPTIAIFPKFKKLKKDAQLHVIYHELGHWFRDTYIPLKDIMGWEEGENFFIYDMQNSDEGFSEAFANFFDDPDDLKKKYPDQYERLKKYIGNMKNSIIVKAKELLK